MCKNEMVDSVVDTIARNDLDIYEILERLGYFQHILSGKDTIKGRVKELVNMGCIDTESDENKLADVVADYINDNGGDFDALNMKTESMADADTDIIDDAIIEAVHDINWEGTGIQIKD